MNFSNRLKKMDGQFGPEQPANADIQSLIDNVHNEVVTQIGHQTHMYNAIVFRVQNLLGGTNWVIKVQIGEGNHDYLHLMIHQTVGVPVPIPPELTGLQQGHTAHDPLVPF